MSGFLVIIYLGVMLYVIYKIVKAVKKSGEPAVPSKPAYRPPVTTNAMKKGEPVSRLMDDRECDWLARQLAEERVAKKRMSDMFELKKEHAANCDAHDLREKHMNNCDAKGTVDATRGR